MRLQPRPGLFSRHITFDQQLQGGGLTEGHLHNRSQSFLARPEAATKYPDLMVSRPFSIMLSATCF